MNKIVDKKVRILLVEDDHITQMVYEGIITKKLPYLLDIASSGSEALKLIDAKYYDLILMDLGLMESDGIRVTQKIRSRHDDKKDTPIVALSNFLDESVTKMCLNVGMNDAIAKPLTENICRELVNRFVKI